MTPVTVVTGFLGSGKTTLINGLLRHPGMADTAVLVNEFGEIAIDHLLVEALDEATVLLGAGCLCCALRDDLAAALADLLARRRTGALPPFRRVLLETSGLADPAPILHTLLAGEDAAPGDAADRYRLEGIVATVSALHGEGQLQREGESLRQAAVADRLVVTKADLAGAAAAAGLRRRLARLNEDAVILDAPASPAALFAPGPFDGGEARLRRWLDAPAAARHDETVAAMALTAAAPLRIDRVAAWIEGLLARHGDRLLRLKGVLDLAGSDLPVAVHGVQHVFHPLRRLAAWPSGRRRSRLVLIGRGLPQRAIEESFQALAAGQGRRDGL